MIAVILNMTVQLPEPFDRLPAAAAAPFQLVSGECLFRTGDESLGCFFLATGGIRLLRRTRDGGETLIHLARAGTTFAEAALFSPVYHCDAIAVTAASGLLLRKAEIEVLFASDTEFAARLAARFARQVQALRRTVEILAIHPARERVMAALGDYEGPDGRLENLPPLKSLAAQIGLTHEALYRAVASLVREGRLIRTGRGSVELAATGLTRAAAPHAR